MPQIIVTAVRQGRVRDVEVMLRERVNLSDFDSRHFAEQLLERLGWAVGDAHEVEQDDHEVQQGGDQLVVEGDRGQDRNVEVRVPELV